MDRRAPLTEINAVFCVRDRAANSRPQLQDVVVADIDEHLMTHHWARQVINLFRQ